MFNSLKKAIAQNKIVAGTSALIVTTASNAAIVATDMPSADYSTIELAALTGFGIALTVGLLSKAKKFFS